MRKYRLVAKKGEGTFSEVLKAQNVKDGRYHAIKCMKNRFENIDQVNNLREIQALRRLSPNEHVVTLEEVLYDQPTGRLALVFELMDGNLYEIIKGRKRYLNPQLIKGYMWQLMKSLDHMHKKGIFHRDIKPENILVDSTADAGHGLKLADFGSCRGIYSKQPYTEYISTRWYRAPECLLTDGYYGPEMDLWGAGCVMFEITTLFPLFPGANEADQIARIHKIIGTKTEALEKLKAKGASHISFKFPPEKGTGVVEHLKHASPEAVDLIHKMLKYDATERISAREAMVHPYFKDMREKDRQRAEAVAAAAQAKDIQGSTASKFTESMTATQSVVKANNKTQSHRHPSGKNVTDAKGSLMPISGTSGLNKALPNINTDNSHEVSHGHKTVNQHQHQNQQQYHKYPSQKPAQGQYHVAQGNDSSLPPIGGSKLKQSGGSNNNVSLSVNGGGSVHGQSSQYAAASNAQKKRKKYRLNYGVQENRNNTNNIMKAYGLNNGGAR